MKNSFDRLYIGLILAIILPFITILLFHLFTYNQISLKLFVQFIASRRLVGELISLCVIPNLLLFFVFIWTNMLYAARGVVMATFFFAFVVAGIKIF